MTVQRYPTSSGTKQGILIAAIVLLFPLVLFATCVWQVFAPDPHPTDEQLIVRFYRHKIEFHELLHMFLADHALERVADDFTRPENPESIGVMPERIAQYRSLLQSLQLDSGIEGYGAKDSIWFLASASGLMSGSSKGYVYMPIPPDSLVSDLDHTFPKDSLPIYRHIEGSWYIYYESI